MAWLREMEVVVAVRSYLETRGFEIDHVVKNTLERGTDTVASSPLKKIVKIEAKGRKFGPSFE